MSSSFSITAAYLTTYSFGRATDIKIPNLSSHATSCTSLSLIHSVRTGHAGSKELRKSVKTLTKATFNRSDEPTQPQSRLLSLSPELQNASYRYALHDEEKIRIDRIATHMWQQPGLLRTCRQIRTEAEGIYNLENSFQFRFIDYDAAAAVAWYQRGHRRWKRVRLRCSAGFEGQPIWENLLCCIRQHRRSQVFGLDAEEGKSAAHNVAPAAFDIVGELWSVKLAWRQLERRLELYKLGVQAGGFTWQ